MTWQADGAAATLSEGELVRWGRRIGERAATPLFLGLRGPLGAGKSVLARAVARGAGVEGPMPSPTFNLVFRYPCRRRIQVVHMDLYRVNEPSELWELGWEALGGPDELVLVEWPERAGKLLPGERWDVELEPVPGEAAQRFVNVRRYGDPPVLPPLPGAGAGARGKSGGSRPGGAWKP